MVLIEQQECEARNANPSNAASGNDASDGFETASDADLGSDYDGNDGEKHQQQEQVPFHSADNASINEEESKQNALVQANEAKVEGNKFFLDGKYEEALSRYELALQVVPDTPSSVELRSICHANRALCFLKLRN